MSVLHPIGRDCSGDLRNVVFGLGFSRITGTCRYGWKKQGEDNEAEHCEDEDAYEEVHSAWDFILVPGRRTLGILSGYLDFIKSHCQRAPSALREENPDVPKPISC